MKRSFLLLILAAALCLSGCAWLDGSYVSVTPHERQSMGEEIQEDEASNYLQLRTILEEMVASGQETRVIRVGQFDQDQLETSLDMAVRHAKTSYPLGAYALEDITWELGTSGGVSAVAVQISYLHDWIQIQRIQKAVDMAAVETLVTQALRQCDTSLVILVENYETADITQMMEDYAADNPSRVMEMPTVTEQTYPSSGSQRVLELKMSYQTSRDDLRSMQNQVQRVFNSAALYVSSDASQGQKYAQLYAFLMERFADYQIKTSITPAYSLLNHGVGDSRAFATVYAQMCREAGLEALVVVGTRNGEPWVWNMIREGEYYYHVDLLDCRLTGRYYTRIDPNMTSYVWDYSAYPVCTGAPAVIPEPGETTIPAETEKTME